MRLRRIRWKGYGLDNDEVIRERSSLCLWLWRQGAQVSAWMLVWEVRWP